MTKIKIFKVRQQITGFEVSGHSGYDKAGKDIVCASVSTLVGSCHLGLEKVLGLKVETVVDKDRGFFQLKLLEESKEAQVLFQTLEQCFEELALEYKKFIKLEVVGG